jgi:tripartite ATP-independent transporter DctM subunit
MLLVFIIFVVFLATGMPVAYAIGIAGMAFFLQHAELPFTMVVQLPVSQTQNFAMLAVPLFIFAANLMNESGITSRFIKLATVLTGHMRGGLAQVSVVLSALMGGVSGSATADAAMDSRILAPDMLKRYSMPFTANVIGFSALITATIPPGVGIIIYGTVGEVSIGQLFSAGLVVGLIMMVLQMVLVSVISRYSGYRKERERRASIREILSSLKETVWALMFPILLLVGIRFGLFTPSEVGAFACVYAILIGVFVYRELTWAKFVGTLINSVKDMGAVMFIIALSGIFGYGIPFDHVPEAIATIITGISTNPHVVLLLIIALLIVVGMLMEGSVAILLFTPILLPLATGLGLDPVHFGMIFCTTITMGLLTPPVGIGMYTVCTIIGCSTREWVRGMWPWLLVTVGMLCILVFLPGVVLFLPRLLFR